MTHSGDAAARGGTPPSLTLPLKGGGDSRLLPPPLRGRAGVGGARLVGWRRTEILDISPMSREKQRVGVGAVGAGKGKYPLADSATNPMSPEKRANPRHLSP